MAKKNCVSVFKGIERLIGRGYDPTGLCVIRMFSPSGRIREFLYDNPDYALKVINSYRNMGACQSATLSIHNGDCWVEFPRAATC